MGAMTDPKSTTSSSTTTTTNRRLALTLTSITSAVLIVLISLSSLATNEIAIGSDAFEHVEGVSAEYTRQHGRRLSDSQKRTRTHNADSNAVSSSNGRMEGVVVNDSEGLLVEVAASSSSSSSEAAESGHIVQSKSITPPAEQLVGITVQDSEGQTIEIASSSIAQSTAVYNENEALQPTSNLETSLSTTTTEIYEGTSTNNIETTNAMDETIDKNNIDTQTIESNLIQTKVINGLSTSRASHPYIVRLHWSNPGFNANYAPGFTFFCGGSLISPNIILTAAHCIGSESHVDIQDTRTNRPTTHKIVKSVVYPLYDKGYFGHDLALIQIEKMHLDVTVNVGSDGSKFWSLAQDEDGDGIDWSQPPIIRLHRYGADGGDVTCTSMNNNEKEALDLTEFTVLGYGRTGFPNGPTSYDDLQSADVHYLKNEVCNEMYLNAPEGVIKSKVKNEVITEEMMCAMDVKEGQDACSGDSGGPLVVEMPVPVNTYTFASTSWSSSQPKLWSQVGLVSWGLGCALAKYPGVYSRIAEQIDWIEETICGDGVKGLSPMSCVFDENTRERHLRDHAMEAFLSKRRKRELEEVPEVEVKDDFIGLDALADEVTQRGRSKVDLQTASTSSETSYIDNARAGLKLSFTSIPVRESAILDEACELVEGPSYIRTSTPLVLQNPITRRPTKNPTPHPSNSPTNRPQSRPTTSINLQFPTSINSKACLNNSVDVSYFLTKRKRMRTCKWVKRKSWIRCKEFGDCCPETCDGNGRS